MNILIITPAGAGSRNGNRATAERWGGLMAELGHQVRIQTDWEDADNPDLVVALHAWRSEPAIRAYRGRFPDRPLIVMLTGTDLYRFMKTHPQSTRYSLAQANVLVGLHDEVTDAVPEPFRSRVMTVYQSAPPCPLAKATESGPSAADDSDFEVCVVGHLREEKDPLRAALAVRNVPRDSRLRVIQLGKAHTQDWADQARQEMKDNPRYQWLGEVPRETVQAVMARARVMVISSIMEGGANVVSEACVCGLPVIASDIPGNRGLLGPAYPGYFATGDTEALSAMLLRAEQDPVFLRSLQTQVRERAGRFTPDQERAGIKMAIEQAVKAARGLAPEPPPGESPHQ